MPDFQELEHLPPHVDLSQVFQSLVALCSLYCNLFPDKITIPISPPFKRPLKEIIYVGIHSYWAIILDNLIT